MRRLRKFLALPARKKALFVKVALLLGLVRIGLKTLPFQKIRSLVDRISEPSKYAKESPAEAVEDIIRAVDVIGCRMPGSCLTQALAARVLLGRRGLDTRLHIGAVKEDEGGFLAHAWLESGGEVVVGGHELERYTPLASFEKGTS
jgi:hypothetical protein